MDVKMIGWFLIWVFVCLLMLFFKHFQFSWRVIWQDYIPRISTINVFLFLLVIDWLSVNLSSLFLFSFFSFLREEKETLMVSLEDLRGKHETVVEKAQQEISQLRDEMRRYLCDPVNASTRPCYQKTSSACTSNNVLLKIRLLFGIINI